MRLVAKVTLEGHAVVPWSAPYHGTGRTSNNNKYRFSKKDPKLTTFQAALKRNAKAVMKDRKPHVGPVYLRVLIHRATKDKSLWGQWCFNPTGSTKGKGDLTNYVKSCEDAVKKVLIEDDTYVCGQNNTCVWGEHDLVEITVLALTKSDALQPA